MSRAWLDSIDPASGASGARRELKSGLTMLGGPRSDLSVPNSGSDSAHLWSEPPKLIFVGGGDPPTVNGRPALEVSLRHGDRIEWLGLVWSFGYDDGSATLTEVSAAAAPRPVAPGSMATRAAPAGSIPAPSATAPSGEIAWQRLKAGMLAELSLSERAVVKRWQDAVVRGEFDAEAAARELIAGAPSVADNDARLADRSTRLMRDLLMSSVTRSAGRQIRQATRHGLAFVISQALVLGIYTLLVLAALLLVHTRFGHSIDAFLDGILGFF